MLYVNLIFAEYGERPLKLVLKVSGNEVTAGSSSRDTFYDEQTADYDKPKEKKKKKKKDKERCFGSPEDDRGKKKVMLLFPSSYVRQGSDFSLHFTLSVFFFKLDAKEEERTGCRWR